MKYPAACCAGARVRRRRLTQIREESEIEIKVFDKI